MVAQVKAGIAKLVAVIANLVSICKSKKSVVAALVIALLYFKQMPTALMICLTIVSVAWIAAQTIVDVMGKKS